MLNRLYIVLGVLVILVLGAAFVVPRLIPWNNYRDRMQVLATEALGADVRINGDIHFALLPAPHLTLADVSVGPKAQPVIAVKSADADFSLMDFLRDRYTMTKLALDHPVLELKVAADGSIDTGLKPAGAGARANLSVADAQLAGGTLRLLDGRSGKSYAIDAIDGTLSVGALGGPFAFNGGGSLGGRHFGFRLTAATLDPAGNMPVSLAVQPDGKAYALGIEGQLATAGAPHFTGDLTYRQAAPTAGNDNGIVGDLTLTGKLDATTQQAGLAGITLTPDENRGAVRLVGSATVDLEGTPAFAARLSSDVLSLPPRDATTEQGPEPYELVRMLGELPAVPVPPLAGTLTATVAELDLRSFSVRNVSLTATAGPKGWAIASLTGQLPGSTSVKLAGALEAPEGRPSFAGTLAVNSEHLDGLASLWRKPAAGNPLLGTAGAFAAKVSLSGQTVALTDGKLTLDGQTHALTALLKLGSARRIDLSGQFGTLSPPDSAALAALVPDVGSDPAAALTFPEGAVSLTADSATVLGLNGKKLALEGKWGGGQVDLSKLAADDLGGARLDLSLKLGGTLAAPRIAGDGSIGAPAGGGPALDLLFDRLAAPQPVRTLLTRALPADLKLHLDDPENTGAQGVTLSGKAGVADVSLVAKLDGGLAGVLDSPLEATLSLSSADARGLTSQLGLGDVSLLRETGPLSLTASLQGPPAGPLATKLSLEGGGDSIGFDGTVTPGDLTAPTGTGKLQLALSDSSVLAGDLGIDGITVPPLKGTARLTLAADGALTLDGISGSSGGDAFSGRLALQRDGKGGAVSGDLTIGSLDVRGLVAATAGPTALLTSAGRPWPDGPMSMGDTPRTTRGSVAVEAPAITRDGQPFLTDAGFTLGWDATNVGVHGFAAKLGGGELKLEANLCCAGPIAYKQLGGQASVTGAALSAVLPPGAAATLSGTLDASARFSGTGDGIDGVIEGLGGDGSFTVSGLKIEKFDPATFAAVASIDGILDLPAQDLATKVAAALDRAAFVTPKLGGSFTIAGGTIRAPNFAADAPAAHLFGGIAMNLANLALGGAVALSPSGPVDAAGLVNPTTSKVIARLGGTLTQPQRGLDIGGMVQAIKVKALENEVARLETLKAQDDARAKAFAAANKEATEDDAARQLAADQAAQATADAAAKQAADAAAAKAAAAKRAQAAAKAAQPAPAPLDLGIPSGQF